LRTTGSVAAGRLADFLDGEATRLEGLATVSIAELDDLRRRWLALRVRQMQAADFLADLPADPKRDAATLGVYAELLGELERLVQEASEQLAVIDDPDATPEARQNALTDAARGFGETLAAARRRLPLRPTLGEASDGLMVAIAEIGRSFDEAAAFAQAEAWSAARFEEVGRRLARARQTLLDPEEEENSEERIVGSGQSAEP
jgi:hypothetical protein